LHGLDVGDRLLHDDGARGQVDRRLRQHLHLRDGLAPALERGGARGNDGGVALTGVVRRDDEGRGAALALVAREDGAEDDVRQRPGEVTVQEEGRALVEPGNAVVLGVLREDEVLVERGIGAEDDDATRRVRQVEVTGIPEDNRE
jgi:hypothetical protein